MSAAAARALAAGAAAAAAPATAADAAGARPATMLLVRYDPREVEVPVGGGENAGWVPPERDLVRAPVSLGSRTPGTTARLARLLPDPALRDLILVQAGPGGPILGAAR